MKTELKVGIFVVLGGFVLFYMTANIEKFGFGNNKGYSIYAILDTAQGLVKKSHVKISGVPIGRISKIDLKGDKARVEIFIPEDVKVQSNAVAYIKMESLLGEKFLDIVQGEKTEDPIYLNPGDEIVQGGEPPDIDRLISQLNRVAKDLKNLTGAFAGVLGGRKGEETIGEIVTNIRDASGNLRDILRTNNRKIGRIVSNMDKFAGELPRMTKEAKEIVSNLSSVTGRIKRGEGTIGRLVQDDELYVNAKDTMSNLNKITGKIERGEGTLGKLINDEEIFLEAKDAIHNLNVVTAKVAKGEGTIGKLLYDTKIYDEAVDAVESLNRIVKKVEKGEGTLGKLVNDEALYTEASRALRGISRSTEGIEEQVPITTLGVIVGTIIR